MDRVIIKEYNGIMFTINVYDDCIRVSMNGVDYYRLHKRFSGYGDYDMYLCGDKYYIFGENSCICIYNIGSIIIGREYVNKMVRKGNVVYDFFKLKSGKLLVGNKIMRYGVI